MLNYTEFCDFKGFPGAIQSDTKVNPLFSEYNLTMTLAECNYFKVSREITDSKEPGLKAIINKDNKILFIAYYMQDGNHYFCHIGFFPEMSIESARGKAGAIKRQVDDRYTTLS
ncbi:DUF4102 domain-containing protein [Escherichia coli]|uniref:DUF4102 domain-containing protein n=1 Tax=Escherichia coli TaxID=562 RepID=UPI000BE4D452|nr:DUF4102 domain-containing protein [Escherichia coli]EEX1840740.1 DUF4102 domain-containing protein [Escherichia coli]HAX2252965.1 DUF4102 domain-containing protein [Escherichia coli]